MLRRGRKSTLLAPALIFAACTEEAHTGAIATIEYSGALGDVLISAHFSDLREPFTPKTFVLPEPSGEIGSETIVILLSDDRDGQQLTIDAKANGTRLVRSVPIVVARGTLVPVSFDLRCGDGRVTTGEACDDENNSSNDGCNAECSAIEPGFVCGDGTLRSPELCDDRNLIGGDGCATDCTQELGWECQTTGDNPSACLDICGDRRVVDNDRCDDGNDLIGDGCDTSCMIEGGWTCTTTIAGGSSICQRCADEMIQGLESCDDGDLVPGDGCDATCTQEQASARSS
jgi:cysteine-rich repeat protein